MSWHVLRSTNDAAISRDLEAAGIVHRRLMYSMEHWNPRKSVVVRRQYPLIAGYIFLRDAVQPFPEITRHRCSLMRDSVSGVPLLSGDADQIILRCEAGEFDVKRQLQGHFEDGARVLVTFLGLVGVVVCRVRKFVYEVMLDVNGLSVTVGQGGLESAS